MTNSEQFWNAERDAALLNEIDDMMRKKIHDLEKAGATTKEIEEAAVEYGQLFDFIEAKITGYNPDEVQMGSEHSETLAERSYFFLEECLFEKLERIYTPNRSISDEQAEKFIFMTRRKLQRLELALFNRKMAGGN